MDNIDALIGDIYEAGALPHLWPNLLDSVGRHFGALGGNLIRSTPEGNSLVSSPGVAEITAEFASGGWHAVNTRVSRRVQHVLHPGFLTDSHLHSPEELATLPMYRDFLRPRAMDAGAGTIVQGGDDDALIIAIEGFPGHAASMDAVPELDRLRPHFARAAVLSSAVEASRAQSAVDACNAGGIALALLDDRGRVLMASDRFVEHFGYAFVDTPTRLRIADSLADGRFEHGMARLKSDGCGTSIALRNAQKEGFGVLHLVPARRDARDIFGKVAAFAIFSRPDNNALPSADIIAALFDLTPAEARVARGVAEGQSPATMAQRLGVTQSTVRSQLKIAFSKTCTSRQSELASLLAGFR